MNEFAIKHKLKWGKEKCNIMRVGKHKGVPQSWKLGDIDIEETSEYKYLGDIITNNGKNTKNIEARKNKLQATTININTIASSEVLNRVETAVLLELHEKMSITAYLNNSETWILNKGDTSLIEKSEIHSIKDLFDLPLHTPNTAIIYTFGLLYTKIRIDQKQLIYLKRILSRNNEDWTRKTLNILKDMNIGWFQNIQTILHEYELPTDFTMITNTATNIWKHKVHTAIEKKNKERIIKECFSTIDGIPKEKTKTTSIIKKLAESQYRRNVQPEILKTTKHEAKTILMARYGMLQCGKNYKGTLSEICNLCNCTDDENHRLSHCAKWKHNNDYDEIEKTNFDLVFSSDVKILRYMVKKISKLWNTRNAHGIMNTV